MKTILAAEPKKDTNKSQPMVRVNVRIPSPLYARFLVEADSRAEELSAPLRRALSAYFAKDLTETRLETIERKLDGLLRANHGADVAARLDELQTAQDSTEARFDELKVDLHEVARGNLEMEKKFVEAMGQMIERLDGLTKLYDRMAKFLNDRFVGR